MNPVKIEKDLATSRPEFFRNLAVALKHIPHTISGDTVTADNVGKPITFTLEPLPHRVLSPLLKVERWKLTIHFQNHSQDDQAEFLRIFDRAFQRGGG